MNNQSLTITDCTLSSNSAGTGGGIDNDQGTATLANTIIAGNTATVTGPDFDGTVTSQGYNLVGNTSASSGWASTDLQNFNPVLAPLANYGGPTQTMALLPGSPAIDAGNNSLIPAGVTTDQRGLPRIVNGTVDIGAGHRVDPHRCRGAPGRDDGDPFRAALRRSPTFRTTKPK